MESFIPFILDHVQYAHWVIFGLLMLAGLNFPISEDLLIILAGILSSTVVPENAWKLFVWVFLGAYLSDWVAYWMGRMWGAKLWDIPWFARVFNPKKLTQIHSYYQQYGVLTLIVGRFIPFGVRNCLFVAAGIGKMNFWKFLLADGAACLFSNSSLFILSYFCGKNCTYLVKSINIVIFSLFLIALIAFIWYKRTKTSIASSIEETID
jgi:membrane-associated protein